MGLLRRLATIGLAVALLIALTSLPTLRMNRTTGSALAPATAWAGGSPDETLKPPSQPPSQRASGYVVQVDLSVGRVSEQPVRLSLAERWLLLYRVYLASVLRI